MADPVLRLDGVVKDYGTTVVTHVLHGVSFTLEAGEFTALTGPSGSGKSTLLNLIGLLDRPTGGRIYVQGQDTSQLDEAGLTLFRGTRLGFIFQFHHLLPAFTAHENTYLPMYAIKGFPDDAMKARATELLGRVGLADYAHRKATDLSGGQQQRVAIARALAQNPPLVLADEPTGNLDTESANDVFELLREFNRTWHTTFLIVTHDSRLAARCDRVIDLVDGRVRSDQRNP
jgi:lipoprotein-releasing system ATP-binding protein